MSNSPADFVLLAVTAWAHIVSAWKWLLDQEAACEALAEGEGFFVREGGRRGTVARSEPRAAAESVGGGYALAACPLWNRCRR